jgi:hypothetical protein
VTDFEDLVRRLTPGEVQPRRRVRGDRARLPPYHGRSDVVYARDLENLERLARTLEPLGPYLRGAPKGLPFRLDVPTLQRGLNFTLTTPAGDLDLLGESIS